jgi:hypothetical protein
MVKIANGFYSTVYEIKESSLVVKKIPKSADAKEELRKFNYLKKIIGKNLPETSFVLASDNEGERRLWIVQEKIDGPHMWQSHRQLPEDEMIMCTQYDEITEKCPSQDNNESNFIFDKKRRILYYVDSFTGVHNS